MAGFLQSSNKKCIEGIIELARADNNQTVIGIVCPLLFSHFSFIQYMLIHSYIHVYLYKM